MSLSPSSFPAPFPHAAASKDKASTAARHKIIEIPPTDAGATGKWLF
jgi:hypothetical protein